MADTKALIEQAKALGDAIAAHPDVQAFMAARAAVDKNPAAVELLKNYGEHANRMHQLEAQQQPIEVNDKQKMAEFEQQLAGDETIKKMMASQMNYVALMNSVNQAMEASLAAKQPAG